MKQLLLVALLSVALILTGCGGGSKPGSPSIDPVTGQPLDPQGNWLFTLTGPGGDVQLQFAGQLYELHPPVVTGMSMGSAQFGYFCGGLTPHGEASGTSTINLTVDRSRIGDAPFQLTGTIAPDEKSMSGTWTNPANGCTAAGSGNWTARLLTAVTGAWTGTADNGLLLSAALTENVDQTSPTMGRVSGSITVSGGGCADSPFVLSSDYASNIHLGEMLAVKGVNTEGVTLAAGLTPYNIVDPDAVTAKGMSFTITGGKCDGQTFTTDLTRSK